MVKLRPGYRYDSRGRPVKIDKAAEYRNRKAAAKAYMEAAVAKLGLNPYPKVRMVCDMKIKLTPRRREIMLAVMLNLLEWRLEPNWAGGVYGGIANMHFVPYYGNTNVASLLTTLRGMKLVRLTQGDNYRYYGPHGGSYNTRMNDYTLTPKGVGAAMEACDYENTREKSERSRGAGRRNGYQVRLRDDI